VNDPQATNQAGWFARTFAYSATIPHAVTSVSPETGTLDTYQYDANGNMTCRIENGAVYTHTYNAENRASSIAKRNTDCTGTIIESWSFAYDGDGVRVTTAHFTGTNGTPDSTTSYFMGGAYELKDGAAKKYYSIAGMMVAVKDSTGAIQYLLTDHLGSTVAVTNASGTLTSQQRYLPFGGTRTIPNSPILGTDFGYTGQRLLDSGMGGIMDYKARFYSPYINHFLQPDSIIPNPANPQSSNRFSYVGNNPIRYNDPSGHCRIDDDADDCFRPGFNNPASLADYGVTIDPKMHYKVKRAILEAVVTVGDRYARERNKNESSAEAFRAVFGTDSRTLYYLYGNSSSDFAYDGSNQYDENGNPIGCNISSGACTVGQTTLANSSPVYLIKIVTMSSNPLSARNNMVHELGHLFGSQVAGYTEMGIAMGQYPEIYNRPSTGGYFGFASVGFPWQQATHNVGSPSEVFADQFLGWIYNTWDTGETRDIGQKRSDWMNVNMATWLTGR
jgi:RHS repeat-associated protein